MSRQASTSGLEVYGDKRGQGMHSQRANDGLPKTPFEMQLEDVPVVGSL